MTKTIQQLIHVIRGKRVILDRDLAMLFNVETKRLNEQVKRNIAKFPEQFMFQLSIEEWHSLRSQIATLENKRGQHPKFLPRVFTEHGVLQAANVLNNPIANTISIQVINVFVEMRHYALTHHDLLIKLQELEKKCLETESFKQDVSDDIKTLYVAVRHMFEYDEKNNQKKFGFI